MVGVVNITTLSNRQYCVILDPVDDQGRPQLGRKKLVKVISEYPKLVLLKYWNIIMSFEDTVNMHGRKNPPGLLCE